MKVDINCDMGEGFGRWKLGDDEAMLDDRHLGQHRLRLPCRRPERDGRAPPRLAKENGVAIGAHPGFSDLWGFGRRVIRGDTMEEVERMIAYQIGAMQACAALAGHTVTHVKAHGALGNLDERGATTSRWRSAAPSRASTPRSAHDRDARPPDRARGRGAGARPIARGLRRPRL